MLFYTHLGCDLNLYHQSIAAISYPKETLKILKILYKARPEASRKLTKAIEATNEIIDTLYKFSMWKLKHFLRLKEVSWLVKLFITEGTAELSTTDEDYSACVETLNEITSLSMFENILANSKFNQI